MICDGIILWWQFSGISKTQMNSMVHWIHLGRLLRPKPCFCYYFQGISNFPGKLEQAPAYCVHGIPISLLCTEAGLFFWTLP